MLQAKKSQPRKEYIVKFGYVHSDPHGNHYKPGDIVALTAQEADLAKHRVSPYVSPTQVKQESDPRPSPGLASRTYVGEPDKAETEQADAVKTEEKTKPEKSKTKQDNDPLAGVLGRGDYQVK